MAEKAQLHRVGLDPTRAEFVPGSSLALNDAGRSADEPRPSRRRGRGSDADAFGGKKGGKKGAGKRGGKDDGGKKGGKGTKGARKGKKSADDDGMLMTSKERRAARKGAKGKEGFARVTAEIGEVVGRNGEVYKVHRITNRRGRGGGRHGLSEESSPTSSGGQVGGALYEGDGCGYYGDGYDMPHSQSSNSQLYTPTTNDGTPYYQRCDEYQTYDESGMYGSGYDYQNEGYAGGAYDCNAPQDANGYYGNDAGAGGYGGYDEGVMASSGHEGSGYAAHSPYEYDAQGTDAQGGHVGYEYNGGYDAQGPSAGNGDVYGGHVHAMPQTQQVQGTYDGAYVCDPTAQETSGTETPAEMTQSHSTTAEAEDVAGAVDAEDAAEAMEEEPVAVEAAPASDGGEAAADAQEAADEGPAEAAAPVADAAAAAPDAVSTGDAGDAPQAGVEVAVEGQATPAEAAAPVAVAEDGEEEASVAASGKEAEADQSSSSSSSSSSGTAVEADVKDGAAEGVAAGEAAVPVAACPAADAEMEAAPQEAPAEEEEPPTRSMAWVDSQDSDQEEDILVASTATDVPTAHNEAPAAPAPQSAAAPAPSNPRAEWASFGPRAGGYPAATPAAPAYTPAPEAPSRPAMDATPPHQGYDSGNAGYTTGYAGSYHAAPPPAAGQSGYDMPYSDAPQGYTAPAPQPHSHTHYDYNAGYNAGPQEMAPSAECGPQDAPCKGPPHATGAYADDGSGGGYYANGANGGYTHHGQYPQHGTYTTYECCNYPGCMEGLEEAKDIPAPGGDYYYPGHEQHVNPQPHGHAHSHAHVHPEPAPQHVYSGYSNGCYVDQAAPAAPVDEAARAPSVAVPRAATPPPPAFAPLHADAADVVSPADALAAHASPPAGKGNSSSTRRGIFAARGRVRGSSAPPPKTSSPLLLAPATGAYAATPQRAPPAADAHMLPPTDGSHVRDAWVAPQAPSAYPPAAPADPYAHHNHSHPLAHNAPQGSYGMDNMAYPQQQPAADTPDYGYVHTPQQQMGGCYAEGVYAPGDDAGAGHSPLNPASAPFYPHGPNEQGPQEAYPPHMDAEQPQHMQVHGHVQDLPPPPRTIKAPPALIPMNQLRPVGVTFSGRTEWDDPAPAQGEYAQHSAVDASAVHEDTTVVAVAAVVAAVMAAAVFAGQGSPAVSPRAGSAYSTIARKASTKTGAARLEATSTAAVLDAVREVRSQLTKRRDAPSPTAAGGKAPRRDTANTAAPTAPARKEKTTAPAVVPTPVPVEQKVPAPVPAPVVEEATLPTQPAAPQPKKKKEAKDPNNGWLQATKPATKPAGAKPAPKATRPAGFVGGSRGAFAGLLQGDSSDEDEADVESTTSKDSQEAGVPVTADADPASPAVNSGRNSPHNGSDVVSVDDSIVAPQRTASVTKDVGGKKLSQHRGRDIEDDDVDEDELLMLLSTVKGRGGAGANGGRKVERKERRRMLQQAMEEKKAERQRTADAEDERALREHTMQLSRMRRAEHQDRYAVEVAEGQALLQRGRVVPALARFTAAADRVEHIPLRPVDVLALHFQIAQCYTVRLYELVVDTPPVDLTQRERVCEQAVTACELALVRAVDCGYRHEAVACWWLRADIDTVVGRYAGAESALIAAVRAAESLYSTPATMLEDSVKAARAGRRTLVCAVERLCEFSVRFGIQNHVAVNDALSRVAVDVGAGEAVACVRAAVHVPVGDETVTLVGGAWRAALALAGDAQRDGGVATERVATVVQTLQGIDASGLTAGMSVQRHAERLQYAHAVALLSWCTKKAAGDVSTAALEEQLTAIAGSGSLGSQDATAGPSYPIGPHEYATRCIAGDAHTDIMRRAHRASAAGRAVADRMFVASAHAGAADAAPSMFEGCPPGVATAGRGDKGRESEEDGSGSSELEASLADSGDKEEASFLRFADLELIVPTHHKYAWQNP